MAYQIIRIDKDKSKSGGNTHGWQVRAGRNLKTGYHSKLFSDGKYGGRDKALAEAEAYLERYLQEQPEYDFKTGQFKWKQKINLIMKPAYPCKTSYKENVDEDKQRFCGTLPKRMRLYKIP